MTPSWYGTRSAIDRLPADHQTAAMTTTTSTAPWPRRALVLALLGALAGAALARLAVPPVERAAATAIAGIMVFVLAFGLLWDRDRLAPALGGALVMGLVAAGGSFWAGPSGPGGGPYGLRLPSSLIAIAVAVPLLQAWLDGRSAASRIRYPRAHDRAWTDLVTVTAALAFALISFLMAGLLGALFKLIGITALERLLQERDFVLPLLGAAVGGGGALARDQASILSTLQNVLRFILSALTPVLAVGLGLFLLSLPFTGLDSLWQATRNTTPILITCVAAALVLANAVIADEADHESRRRPLRAAAMLLLACNLPLAIIAAISVSKRVDQYGWTPDRLWAAVIVALALAYGVAGLWALLQPARWMARVRASNLGMGFGLCAVALLLATPIADFGAISTRSQVARLESGKVTLAAFDWTALRYEFGPAGVAALRELARSEPAETAKAARFALQSVDRWDFARQSHARQARVDIARNLFVLPRGADGHPRAAPAAISANLAESHGCGDAESVCVLQWLPGSDSALAFVGISRFGGSQSVQFRLRQGTWVEVAASNRPMALETRENAWLEATRVALAAGRVEVRDVKTQQLLINGKVEGSALPPQ